MKLAAPSPMGRRAWLSAPSHTSIIAVRFHDIRHLPRARYSRLSCSPPHRGAGQRSLQEGIGIIRSAIDNFRPKIVDQVYGEAHHLEAGLHTLSELASIPSSCAASLMATRVSNSFLVLVVPSDRHN